MALSIEGRLRSSRDEMTAHGEGVELEQLLVDPGVNSIPCHDGDAFLFVRSGTVNGKARSAMMMATLSLENIAATDGWSQDVRGESSCRPEEVFGDTDLV